MALSRRLARRAIRFTRKVYALSVPCPLLPKPQGAAQSRLDAERREEAKERHESRDGKRGSPRARGVPTSDGGADPSAVSHAKRFRLSFTPSTILHVYRTLEQGHDLGQPLLLSVVQWRGPFLVGTHAGAGFQQGAHDLR